MKTSHAIAQPVTKRRSVYRKRPVKILSLDYVEPNRTDPLYQAVIDFPLGKRLRHDAVAKAAYKSERFAKILRFLTLKTGIDIDEARQEIVMALLNAVRKETVIFPNESTLFSYLIRAGSNIHAKGLSQIDSQFLSYDALEVAHAAGAESDVLAARDHSDAGAQAAATEEALDERSRAGLRQSLQAYRLTNKSMNSMLKLSSFSPAITHVEGAALPNTSSHTPPAVLAKNMDTRILAPQLRTPKVQRDKQSIVPHFVATGRQLSFDAEVLGTTPSPRGRPRGTSRKVSSTSDRRSKQHADLFDMWKQSKLLQSDYAEQLGITAPTLKSYLYAITKNVPLAVLKAAREHAKVSAKQISVLEGKFKGSMIDIVARWEKDIAKEKLVSYKLAAILGVDESTVMRWRSKSKPTIRALARYELLLKDYYKKF